MESGKNIRIRIYSPHYLVTLIFLGCISHTLQLRAQDDTVSVREMADGFMKQCVEHGYAREEWYENDVVYFGYLRDSVLYISGEDSNSGPAYSVSPGLRQAGGSTLPPSVYLWVTQDAGSIRNETGFVLESRERHDLYWLRFRTKKAGNRELARQLEEEYGSTVFNDTLRAVPAAWGEGRLACLGTPCMYYGYQMLSSRLHRGMLHKGRIAVRKEHDWVHVYAPGCNTLGREAVQIDRGSMHSFATADGKLAHHSTATRIRMALNLLTIKLNDALRRMGRTEEWEKKGTVREFALLFYMDRQHKTYLRPLIPQEPDAVDRRLLADLAAALDEQPPGILPEFYALDGRRFAGVYLKARCVHGRWTLEDYIGDFYYEL